MRTSVTGSRRKAHPVRNRRLRWRRSTSPRRRKMLDDRTGAESMANNYPVTPPAYGETCSHPGSRVSLGAHNVPLVDAADLGAAPPPVEPAGAPPPCCAGLAGARAGTRCGASHGRRRRSSRCTASIRASTPWASAKQCGWRCSSGSARRSSRNGCHHGSVSRLLVTPGPAGSIKLPHSSQINSAPRRMGDIVPHRPLRCAARRGSAHEPYQDGVDAGELRSFLPAGLTAARAGIWRSWRR